MRYIPIILALVFLSSCQDVVTIENNYDGNDIVVDAWLKNDGSEQSLELYYAQNYYDNSPFKTIDDAQVKLYNGTESFDFVASEKGKYAYSGGELFGETGDTIRLEITFEDQVISAISRINRVPEIDSIKIYEEEDRLGIKGGKYAELYVRDLPGIGDTYWVRSYKNDTLLSRPREIALIYDAGFDPGADGLDGKVFIRPLRLSINPIGDDGMGIPYKTGDVIYTELWSIDYPGFRFLQTVFEQSTNGDNTIFSLPIYNATSNISSSNSEQNILGYFNVAGVSSIEKVVD